MLLFFHQKSWSPYPKTKTPANYSLAKVAPAPHDLIEGQGGLAFESEGYVLFELRVNAALKVLRFNAEGPAGLIDRKAPGKVAKLNGDQRRALAARVERGPVPAVDGVVRSRLCDLVQWIFEDFGVSLDETTVGRELRATSACQHPCAGAAHER